jgi:hypothetical protein
MTEEVKPVSNELRVGSKIKPKEFIEQCTKLLKDDKLKEIHLSAIGAAIGELVVSVEIVKSIIPDLFQKNIFSTIPPFTKEKEKKIETKNDRLYPKLEIILSVDKIIEKEEKKSITEVERKILMDTIHRQKENLLKGKKMFRNARNRRRRLLRFRYRRFRNAFSAKKKNYPRRNIGYNRRPFAPFPKNLINMRTFNRNRKNSGNRSAARSPVKN